MGNLKWLHAVPWLLFISSFFFMAMWWTNGACCCWSNGSLFQSLAFGLPQTIFWLLAFVLNMIFAVIGWAWSAVIMEQEATMFKGNPRVGDLLAYIQSTYPQFWSIAKFDELEDGLSLFRTATTIFVLCCVLMSCYSGCFCCLRPYPKRECPGPIGKTDGIAV